MQAPASAHEPYLDDVMCPPAIKKLVSSDFLSVTAPMFIVDSTTSKPVCCHQFPSELVEKLVGRDMLVLNVTVRMCIQNK